MRLYRNAIILVIVLGLLLGAYVAATKKTNDKQEAESPEQAVSILKLDSDKMSEIAITNKEGRFVLEKKQKDDKNQEWLLVSPQGFKADTSVLDSIAFNISSLSAEKVVDENAADLAQYGFTKPIEIEVKYEGGSKVLELGDMNSTNDGYYIKEKDSSKVYIISSYTGDTLKADKNSLRDKKLYSLDIEKAESIAMSKGNELVFSAKKSGEGQWSLTAPIEGNADYAKISPILEALSNNNSFQNFVEEKPVDLDKYGLKNPAYTLEFVAAGSKTKLLIGNVKERGKEMYAKLADSSEVFTINETAFNFLDKPLKEIMQVFAYIVNIQDVSKVEVNIDGTTTTSEISTDKDDNSNDKFIVNGKDASALKDEKDKSLFRNYYQAIIGVTMDELDKDAKPSGEAEITFTYTLNKAPETMKVEFVPKDNNYYYVIKNGKYANMLVSKKKFDEPEEGLRAAQKKLLEALRGT